jgi:GT2 family glycosyltransferase
MPYELVIVDNGSDWEAANYARLAADTSVLNDRNLGFARGMNQGLAAARGEWVAFCNNDTVLPSRWAERLLETAQASERAGIVVPALTAARNPATVRTEPGEAVDVIAPFSAPPAAVVYLMRADVVRALGGWGEEYDVASGEDVDLAFKVWVNDLDIVYDQRVLVEHVGKGSASRLDDWEGLWERNRRMFLAKWQGDAEVPRLDECAPERFARNREIARSVAGWMEQYFAARGTSRSRKAVLAARVRSTRARATASARVRWRKVRGHLPPKIAARVARFGRRLGD